MLSLQLCHGFTCAKVKTEFSASPVCSNLQACHDSKKITSQIVSQLCVATACLRL